MRKFFWILAAFILGVGIASPGAITSIIESQIEDKKNLSELNKDDGLVTVKASLSNDIDIAGNLGRINSNRGSIHYDSGKCGMTIINMDVKEGKFEGVVKEKEICDCEGDDSLDGSGNWISLGNYTVNQCKEYDRCKDDTIRSEKVFVCREYDPIIEDE